MRLRLSRLKLQLSTPNIYCHTFAESMLNFKRRFKKSDKADNASAFPASRSPNSAAISPTVRDTTSWTRRTLVRYGHPIRRRFLSRLVEDVSESSADHPPPGASGGAPPASEPATDTLASGAQSAGQVNVEVLGPPAERPVITHDVSRNSPADRINFTGTRASGVQSACQVNVEDMGPPAGRPALSCNSPAGQVNIGSPARPSAPTTNARAQDAGQVSVEGPGPRAGRSAAPGASGISPAGQVNVESPAGLSAPNIDARASSAQDTDLEPTAGGPHSATHDTSPTHPALPRQARLSALPFPTASEPEAQAASHRLAPGASGISPAGQVNIAPAGPSAPNTDARASSAQDTDLEPTVGGSRSAAHNTSRTLPAIPTIPCRARLSALPSPTASELKAQATSHPCLPPVERRMNLLTEGAAIVVSMVFPVFVSPQDVSQLHGFNLTSFLLSLRILFAYFVPLVLGAVFAGGFPKKAPSHVGCLFNYGLLIYTAGGIREGELT